MTYQLPESDIERFIDEDLPYGDLTTILLGIGAERGSLTFTSRETTVLCCTEDAARVIRRCGATVIFVLGSGTLVEAGTVILSAEGPAESLHSAWKVALNLLEYASGIATRTRQIVEKARAVSPAISVVTTRKSFPGTKKVALKAIMAGGALPHRLGLSESVLVFRQHTVFLGGLDNFLVTLGALKAKTPEHKIIVEADTAEEALAIAEAGADVVQIDKLPPSEFALAVSSIKSRVPAVTISAAGGINGENVAEYALAGADIIVLSSVYFGKPADIGVSIHQLQT